MRLAISRNNAKPIIAWRLGFQSFHMLALAIMDCVERGGFSDNGIGAVQRMVEPFMSDLADEIIGLSMGAETW